MHTHFSVGLVAALLLAAPATAGDLPGNASTKATLRIHPDPTRGYFELSPDVDWYRIELKKGQDYAFRLSTKLYEQPATLTLLNPRRKRLRAVNSDIFMDTGFEFRAPTAGTYFVEIRGEWNPREAVPQSYDVTAVLDCKDGPDTTCVLDIGRRRNSYSISSSDTDRFALTLERSKRYTIAVTPGTEYSACFVELFDPDSVLIAEARGGTKVSIEDFQTTRSGKHYLRVLCDTHGDFGAKYSVLVTAG